MASCQGCGAPVTWARIEGTEDERVPLDNVTTFEGEGRFRIVGTEVKNGNNLQVVVPVVKEYKGDAYQDHRRVCVAQDRRT